MATSLRRKRAPAPKTTRRSNSATASSLFSQAQDSIETPLTRAQKSMYQLPFDSKFLEDLTDFPPAASKNSDMTSAELLAWVESPNIRKKLIYYKKFIIDVLPFRAQIQGGFKTDYKHSWDTIDTIIQLCYSADTDVNTMPTTDAFEATAWCACKLVISDEPISTSPFHGLLYAGYRESRWCFHVAIRLFITVFRDLLHHNAGYFLKRLRGPEVKHIRNKEFLNRVATIDNSPYVTVSEKKGLEYRFLEEQISKDPDHVWYKGSDKGITDVDGNGAIDCGREKEVPDVDHEYEEYEPCEERGSHGDEDGACDNDGSHDDNYGRPFAEW